MPKLHTLQWGGDTHDLKPGSDRKAVIEGKPDEGAHLLRSGVVPDSGDGLLRDSVPKVKSLDEGEHVRWPREISSVGVSSFGGVAKEGSVPKGRGGLPVPLSGVPGVILDKSRFKDPEDWSFLARSFQLLSDSEARLGAFL